MEMRWHLRLVKCNENIDFYLPCLGVSLHDINTAPPPTTTTTTTTNNTTNNNNNNNNESIDKEYV